jgi:hypothetical protein
MPDPDFHHEDSKNGILIFISLVVNNQEILLFSAKYQREIVSRHIDLLF